MDPTVPAHAPAPIDSLHASAWTREALAVKQTLSSGFGPGVMRREQVAAMNGLQAMQAMLRGELPYPPIADTLDFMLVQVGPGQAVFQGVPQAGHLNPMGGVHGGWYVALLDSALGCAVHTTIPVGRGYTTAELSLNLVRAAKLEGEPLRAIGTVLHSGRQLATAEARLVDESGRLYAHATTTCLVFALPIDS